MIFVTGDLALAQCVAVPCGVCVCGWRIVSVRIVGDVIGSLVLLGKGVVGVDIGIVLLVVVAPSPLCVGYSFWLSPRAPVWSDMAATFSLSGL